MHPYSAHKWSGGGAYAPQIIVARSIVSNLDLSSQLNDAVGRDLEVLDDASSVSDHRRKQSFAPHRHAGSRPRYHRLPAQEERGFEHVELEIVGPTCRQCL